jgi:hypothetical protein
MKAQRRRNWCLRWDLANTDGRGSRDCTSDADFLAKFRHLCAHERRNLGGLFSHDDGFGKLVHAIELHLGQAADSAALAKA